SSRAGRSPYATRFRPSRRGEHLLAVAGAEGGQDRVLVLAAREAPGDLLLHRLARRAVEVVAGVDGEPAAALAGERLLDLLLGRRSEEQTSELQSLRHL